MLRKFYFFLYLIILLFYVGLIRADDLDDGPSIDNIPSVNEMHYSPNFPNIYISGSLGYGRVFQDLRGMDIRVNRNFVWNGALGMQFTRQFALEGGYIQLPTVVGRAGYRSNATYLASHLIYQPEDSRYNVFAKIGVADNSRSKKTLFLGGIGFSFYLAPQLTILAQFIDIPGNDSVKNVMMGLLGLTYFIPF